MWREVRRIISYLSEKGLLNSESFRDESGKPYQRMPSAAKPQPASTKAHTWLVDVFIPKKRNDVAATKP
jgi:hypothetical protein